MWKSSDDKSYFLPRIRASAHLYKLYVYILLWAICVVSSTLQDRHCQMLLRKRWPSDTRSPGVCPWPFLWLTSYHSMSSNQRAWLDFSIKEIQGVCISLKSILASKQALSIRDGAYGANIKEDKISWVFLSPHRESRCRDRNKLVYKRWPTLLPTFHSGLIAFGRKWYTVWFNFPLKGKKNRHTLLFPWKSQHQE